MILSGSFPKHAYNVASGRMDTGYTRHKRVLNPAFNNDLYRHVWDETLQAYEGVRTAEKWNEQATLDVPDLISVMSSVPPSHLLIPYPLLTQKRSP